jgi:hypothetical protein
MTLGPKASLDVAADSQIPSLLENDHSLSARSQPLKYCVKLLKYATVEWELWMPVLLASLY